MSVDLAPTRPDAPTRDGIGADVHRPDGTLKVQGRFAFSSDLSAEDMLWGATVRSPHPAARVVEVDTARARRTPGCVAVLTANDVPGRNRFGLVVADQPVLAEDEVRYAGEPVAIVAADSPEAARRAASAVEVTYAPLPPITTVPDALAAGARPIHPDGNLVRRVTVQHGVLDDDAPVVVRGTYEVGVQDQAALGTESGLALPTVDGGIELYAATQWLHVDRSQLAVVLDLPPERIHLVLAGVGGAFGAKEDLSLQAHLCLLAQATGRPVKMAYSRRESFFGHVHRHPAQMRYEHAADRDGHLRHVRCEVLLDGGAYASTTAVVTSNAAAFAIGPYACPAVELVVDGAYTNNPPAGAMRGFGAVQVAFAHEAQMDRLAARVGVDPIELRRRNALRDGDRLVTGQGAGSVVPVLTMLDRLDALPPPGDPTSVDDLPGGPANVTAGEDVVRGVGYAIGFKNGGMPEGLDDYATARVGLRRHGARITAVVQTAAAELGQGLVTVQEQIVRTELGVSTVVGLPASTAVGSAGTSSASRQTYMTGGAVRDACVAVRDQLLVRAYGRVGHRWPELLEHRERFRLGDDHVVAPDGARVCAVADLLDDGEVIEAEREFRHRPTQPLDEDGQGHAHLQFLYAAHRAVVDVDLGTGLVRVVDLAVVQDVGRAINPVAVEGQLEGATTQGLGLALLEELQIEDGRIVNPSFTDYLIPTTLDVPTMHLEILELPDPDAPYGIKGAGEPATISSTPAIVAALRAATGHALPRVPVRPHELLGSLHPS